MELVDGFLAGVMATLAVILLVSYRQKKDREYLLMALIAAVFVPLSLLGKRYVLVTGPLVWGLVVFLGSMLYRQRKRRT